MKHSTGKPTKAEAQRMARLKELPCAACKRSVHVEIHHLKHASKRRGHMFTIPLCRWCHQGQATPFSTETVEGMTINIGPSLARGSKPFHAFFGTDEELLAATNALLKSALVAGVKLC